MPDPQWRLLSGREELRYLCDQRRASRSKVTNLILGNERVSAAADKGLIFTLADEPGGVFIFDDIGARRVYFIQETWDSAAKVIAQAASVFNERTVVDVVGREGALAAFDQLFGRSGFSFYKRFQRMSRRPSCDAPITTREDIPHLGVTEVELVMGMIQDHFDPLAEFLPSLAELQHLAVHGAIWAARRRADKLSGFLVHEAIGNTSLLRYVAVAAEERGKGLGGALIAQYLRDTCDAVRHDLWVWEQNDPAIRHYLANGFTFTGLYNAIYQFKE